MTFAIWLCVYFAVVALCLTFFAGADAHDDDNEVQR